MKRRNVLTIGILGGMGPEATNQLCHNITSLTAAKGDQDHIPVITYNNSAIPSRVNAILCGGESPVPEMTRTALILQQAGADMILMPCNCAHYYLEEIQQAVSIPVLDMIEETVSYICRSHSQVKRVGILASTPTLQMLLYEKPLGQHDITLIKPSAIDQDNKVMKAIYGTRGIKSGYKLRPRTVLTEVAQEMISRGAELIIAGCTEVSLVLVQGKAPFTVIDPMEVIARVAVARALQSQPSITLLPFEIPASRSNRVRSGARPSFVPGATPRATK